MVTSFSPVPKGLLLVGRFEQYLKNPTELLPVSCTVAVIKDQIFGSRGIVESFTFTSRGLRYGAGVAVHVSNFKPFRPVPVLWRPYIDPSHPDAPDFDPQYRIQPGPNAIVIQVQDSMEGEGSIESSWETFVSRILSHPGKEIVIDVSALRPKGQDNQRGLVASGPLSFCTIYGAIANFLNQGTLTSLCSCYSALNEVLRRGGLFKNGAVTLHFDYDQPEALEFCNLKRSATPWARLCLNIDEKFLWLDDNTLEEFLKPVSTGDLFIVKKSYDAQGTRTYANVCLEIRVPPYGTCMLAHINVGTLKPGEIPTAMEEGMEWLCRFRQDTSLSRNPLYLGPDEDRQVGLGVLGLANLLAIEGITYVDFVEALEKELSGSVEDLADAPFTDAHRLAVYLMDGFEMAAEVAKRYGMERAFCVAPTASCSFKGRDRHGYTTAPEIAPPIDIAVDRDSGTLGVQSADYHPDCETAVQVGYDVFFRLNSAWQEMMNRTGLAHAISTNWWSDQVTMDREWITRFMNSPQESCYYALPVQPAAQDKSTTTTQESCGIKKQECSACAE